MTATATSRTEPEREKIGYRYFNSRRVNFAVLGLVTLGALAMVGLNSGASRAQTSQDQLSEVEKARYADALAFCRSNAPHPMSIRDDKKVGCFDGEIKVDLDLSSVEGLKIGGLFVVRSAKGDTITAIKLADLLLKKQATVIINDYCLGNCANYIFVASGRTFVAKGALVAWRYVGEHRQCLVLSETSDPSAPRFDAGACRGGFHDNGRNEYVDQLRRKFYEGRAPAFAMPPESTAVRRALKGWLDSTGADPAVYWTWNPRYAGAIATKVFYEAYPQSQDEVDTIAVRIGLQTHVIYDP